MLEDLRRVAAGARTLSGPSYAKHGRMARQSVATRFGTWRRAVALAGLCSPTVKGGQHRPCVVCGKDYRYDGGAKSCKTCSEDCREILSVTCRVNRKDSPTAQAERGRARRLFVAHLTTLSCEACGEIAGRIEVHHRDRNWRNNALGNLQALCATCHGVEHRKRPPAACCVCGRIFRPRRDTSIACSYHCSGVWNTRRRRRSKAS